MNYHYIACFVSRSELLEKIAPLNGSRLSRIIEHPHVTFHYKPDHADETLFGKKVDITAIAYGNDGVNEGLKVTLSSDDPKLQALAEQIEVPHITVSISETGKAVNTRDLDFVPITPIKLTGTFGGCTESKEIILHS